jgi:hypothetical protein
METGVHTFFVFVLCVWDSIGWVGGRCAVIDDFGWCAE